MSQPQVVQYDDMVTVTKNDGTNDPAGPFAGLYVDAAGTLKVTTYRNTTISFTGVVAGTYIKVPVRRVWSTGTSATVLGCIAATQAQGT